MAPEIYLDVFILDENEKSETREIEETSREIQAELRSFF